MSNLTGTLTLTIIDAKDLNNEDLFVQDPYCKISLGGGMGEGLKSLLSGGGLTGFEGDHWKTKVDKMGGRSPKWNESHSFHLKDVKPDTVFNVHLMDQDMGPDDYIGVAEIPIRDFLENQTKGKHYYQLVEKGHARKIAGYIGISSKFEGTGGGSGGSGLMFQTLKNLTHKEGKEVPQQGYSGPQQGQQQGGWQGQQQQGGWQGPPQQGGWQGPQQGGWQGPPQQGGWQGPPQQGGYGPQQGGWQGPQQGGWQQQQQPPQQGYGQSGPSSY